MTRAAARSSSRRYRSMATLVAAAHTHHNDVSPPTVNQTRTTTATRFDTPKRRIQRSLARSNAPHVATA